jgi:2-octaprenylphenol hydroxylase
MADVAVVGGGPVGACAAALLQRAGLEVALLEPHPPAPLEARAPLESRVVALSRASERLLSAAGAWPLIAGPRVCAYQRMRIWHESVAAMSAAVLVFDAADVGEPNLGYILENRLLQHALLQAFTCRRRSAHPGRVESLRSPGPGCACARRPGSWRRAPRRGADGAHSQVREAAGLTAASAAYEQLAIIANVATAKPHQFTAWQRFMKDGTLAFLPLADGTSSIVWSVDAARAPALLSATDAEFARALERGSDLALGATRLVSARRSFVLQRLAAPRYVAQRVALIGDAAHVVHPLAGQGVNLGLLDAAALAQLLGEAVARREDVGALGVLRPTSAGARARWR